MIFLILLALAFGSPNMTFPWWVWVLAILFGSGDTYVTAKKARER